MPFDRALLVKSPYIDQILSGDKTWEIRGSRTDVLAETIGLIRIGSGTVVGTCEIVDVVGPLTLAEMRRNAKRIGAQPKMFTKLPYPKGTFAWVLRKAKRLRTPIPYKHPSGAVRWVKFGANLR